VTGVLRAVACRLLRRHRPVGVVLGGAVVVACPRCRSGVEAPLVAPVRPAAAPPGLVLPPGVVLVDAAAFDELRAAYLIESAFAGMSGEEP
jgi:hypothetical protein